MIRKTWTFLLFACAATSLTSCCSLSVSVNYNCPYGDAAQNPSQELSDESTQNASDESTEDAEDNDSQ